MYAGLRVGLGLLQKEYRRLERSGPPATVVVLMKQMQEMRGIFENRMYDCCNTLPNGDCISDDCIHTFYAKKED